MTKLRGLATGIGSLPHKDADSALDLIFKYMPNAPFWPQLPKINMREGMVVQFSENFPALKMSTQGLLFYNEGKEKELEAFYERIIAEDLEYFKITPDFALGLHKFLQRLEKTGLKGIEFIKFQCTGPYTMAASIVDEKGVALLHDKVFMQAIVKGIEMKARWQIEQFRRFGKKMILFFDEPYLGCFGSAFSPINRNDVVGVLSDLTASVKASDVLLAVHCCGNTDWSILTDIASLDIISFDAFSFLDRLVLYAGDLKNFLKRGGVLCWGIVPTHESEGEETADMLVKKIKEGINTLVKKGIDIDLLLENLFISPSCGLGTLAINRAEEVFKMLSETACNISRQKLFDNFS